MSATGWAIIGAVIGVVLFFGYMGLRIVQVGDDGDDNP